MSIYLLREFKKFRCDSELEAERLMVEMKKKYDVVSKRVVRKDKKDETYFIVEISIAVNSEKEPYTSYSLED